MVFHENFCPERGARTPNLHEAKQQKPLPPRSANMKKKTETLVQSNLPYEWTPSGTRHLSGVSFKVSDEQPRHFHVEVPRGRSGGGGYHSLFPGSVTGVVREKPVTLHLCRQEGIPLGADDKRFTFRLPFNQVKTTVLPIILCSMFKHLFRCCSLYFV